MHDEDAKDTSGSVDAQSFGIPYARVDEITGDRICPVCAERIAEHYDGEGEPQTRNYALHYAEEHGPLRWGMALPKDVANELESEGVVTTSAQRAYREARHHGLAHAEAVQAAVIFAVAEAESMGLG
jgi:hypothetical protein